MIGQKTSRDVEVEQVLAHMRTILWLFRHQVKLPINITHDTKIIKENRNSI